MSANWLGSLVPRPSPSFPSLAVRLTNHKAIEHTAYYKRREAGRGKLGEGLEQGYWLGELIWNCESFDVVLKGILLAVS